MNIMLLKRILPGLCCLVAACQLTGCMAYRYDYPPLQGRVFNQGKAQPGVKVSAVTAGSTEVSAVTDEQGYFKILPEKQWFFFIPVGPQDRRLSWDLALDWQSERSVVWHGAGIASPVGAVSDQYLTFTCALKGGDTGTTRCQQGD